MASISKAANGHRTIQFVGGDGKRRSIRLGKVSQRLAEQIKFRVEALNAAVISRCPLDGDTAAWVASIGDDLAAKLAAVGLIAPRSRGLLGEFIDAYIERRTDAKPLTVMGFDQARTRMVAFFGPDRPLSSITPADGDAWLIWLRDRFAPATAARTFKRGSQFLRAACRARLLPGNPFEGIRVPSQANDARSFFVTQETTQRILDACPDAEWRLIVALCRYGGLRCPSELLPLRWTDVRFRAAVKRRFTS
jgi:integrase